MMPKGHPVWMQLGLRDPVVRMVVIHWGLGMALGAATAALLLIFDIAQLRSLLVRSDAEIPGAILLIVSFAVTFGGVVSATAVMFEPKHDQH